MKAVNEKAIALAALMICESLLIKMVETGMLNPEDARDLLDDAAGAQRSAASLEPDDSAHQAAAGLIDQIAQGIYLVKGR